MLISIALIMILGFALSGLFNKFRLPGLLGMIFAGILLGPQVSNLISPSILDISAELREIALIVILIRAGLSLDLEDLKSVGRPAILLSFLPGTLEMIAIVIFAPIFFHVSYIEAALMGSIVAAVSPAVVVPRMINLLDKGYGTNKNIPQLIMAAASIDDVYLIMLFTSFLSMYEGDGFHVSSLLSVPLAIITGVAVGYILGLGLIFIFKKIHMRDTIKVIIILSISFLLVGFEPTIQNHLPFSALLSVMALGVSILKNYTLLAKRLMGKFTRIWVGSEIILFVLVGAVLDLSSVEKSGFMTVILILLALVFRLMGVGLSLVKSSLNFKEKIFCSIAYVPKATVQAAIGAIPLAAGVEAGQTILTVAVLAILITAPLGAIGIDNLYKRLLSHDTL